jgi:3-deoxy-D-manno-octulosonic-acid transferase/heptosyltransferase-1
LRLRDESYDIFVDMQPSVRSFVLRRVCGAKHTLVYRKQKRARSGNRRIHAVDNFMETLRPLDIVESVESIDLPLRNESLRAVDRFLSEEGIDGNKPLIGLNCSVGAARPARNWFPERFSTLADRMIRELGAEVVFVGGKEDEELVRNVMAAMKETGHSAAGKLSIAESAALLARCTCLVSSDTGPLHLATAVRTCAVSLVPPTSAYRPGRQRTPVLIKNPVAYPAKKNTALWEHGHVWMQ